MTTDEMKLLRPRRNIRDSVFKFIVKRTRYLREVYLSLYPDDAGIREDEIRLLTSENVFIGSVIHDCCFLVRNERLVFIEVQSTPCRLLPERMVRYYAQMIPRLSPDWDGRQYSACGLDLPFPEFWVIYAQSCPILPICLSLSLLHIDINRLESDLLENLQISVSLVAADP